MAQVENGSTRFLLEREGKILGPDFAYHQGGVGINVSKDFVDGVRDGIFVPGTPTHIRTVEVIDGRAIRGDRKPF